MLIKLPSGDWIDPEDVKGVFVCSVKPKESSTDFMTNIYSRTDNGVCQIQGNLVDEIARMINDALLEVQIQAAAVARGDPAYAKRANVNRLEWQAILDRLRLEVAELKAENEDLKKSVEPISRKLLGWVKK